MQNIVCKKLKQIALSYGSIEKVNRQFIIITVGLLTSFFGFAAGAVINLILIATNDPLVTKYRATLTYTSSILGDGIVLPVVNMFIISFILKNKDLIEGKVIKMTFLLGFLITAYFHVTQALNNIVNWAMPQPWRWNSLGIAHAVYMFSETSFISFFFLLTFKYTKKHRQIPKEAVIATAGILIFLVLLRVDYMTLDWSSLIP